jgi:hypothetical protein
MFSLGLQTQLVEIKELSNLIESQKEAIDNLKALKE